MAILIRQDGSTGFVRPKNGKSFTLEEAQALVGGYVELINTFHGNLLLINEEGKFNPNLQVNHSATKIAHESGIARDDYIVGDCVYCEREEFQ